MKIDLMPFELYALHQMAREELDFPDYPEYETDCERKRRQCLESAMTKLAAALADCGIPERVLRAAIPSQE